SAFPLFCHFVRKFFCADAVCRHTARPSRSLSSGGAGMNRLLDKTALITGAASGIGRAAALLFLAEGARVLAVDQDGAALESLEKDANSANLAKLCADLRDSAQVLAAVQAARRLGALDIAVFNAGICGANMPLEDYPEALFDDVLAINLKAAWLGLRAVVPGMKERKRGSIIFTS